MFCWPDAAAQECQDHLVSKIDLRQNQHLEMA
jgi:hypothetical protein